MIGDVKDLTAPSGAGGITSMSPRMPVEQREREIGGRIKKERDKLAQADAKMKEAEMQVEANIIGSRAQSREKQATDIRDKAEETKRKQAEFADVEFHPTEENAQSLAQLFSLVATSGLLLGSSGKMSAMNSLAAMNGMMEGWRSGRADLYKREVDKFNKEIDRRRRIREDLRQDLEDFIKLSATDREAADLKREEVIRKAGTSSIIGQYMLKSQAENALKTLEADLKIEQDIAKRQQDARMEERRMREEKRKSLSEERRAKHQEFMERMTLARLRLAEEKKQSGQEGKPLKEKEISQLEGLDSLATELRKLEKDFKPEYASLGLLGFGADMSLEAKRRLGDAEGAKAVQWWAKYQRLQAPNRHALFGATLTGNELKNYQSFTAKPSDDPTIVRNMLLDQADYSEGTASQRKFAYEKSGFKVPQTAPRPFLDTYSGGQQAKPMPSGDKLKVYADQYFGGDQTKAKDYLSSQGYK